MKFTIRGVKIEITFPKKARPVGDNSIEGTREIIESTAEFPEAGFASDVAYTVFDFEYERPEFWICDRTRVELMVAKPVEGGWHLATLYLSDANNKNHFRSLRTIYDKTADGERRIVYSKQDAFDKISNWSEATSGYDDQYLSVRSKCITAEAGSNLWKEIITDVAGRKNMPSKILDYNNVALELPPYAPPASPSASAPQASTAETEQSRLTL